MTRPIGRLMAAVLALAPTTGLAAFYDGNGLHELCETYPASARAYAAGVVDTLLLDQENKGTRAYVCVPSNVTAGQVEDVVCQYLEAHPEQRHYSAASTAEVALMKSFPCK